MSTTVSEQHAPTNLNHLLTGAQRTGIGCHGMRRFYYLTGTAGNLA